jgi:hypothetical protein
MLGEGLINRITAHKKNEAERKSLKLAYDRVFRTEDGKKVLEDLKKFCGYDQTSICEATWNPYQTFFAEGKRRVYLRILNQRESE